MPPNFTKFILDGRHTSTPKCNNVLASTFKSSLASSIIQFGTGPDGTGVSFHKVFFLLWQIRGHWSASLHDWLFRQLHFVVYPTRFYLIISRFSACFLFHVALFDALILALVFSLSTLPKFFP